MPYGTIYMLPTPIGDRPVYDVLPEYNRAVMARLDYFIVENERTARRFLSRAGIGKPIDGLRIAELNEHTAAPMRAYCRRRVCRAWPIREPT